MQPKHDSNGHYTKYCNECDTVFHVPMVTFLMIVLMNNITRTILPTYLEYIQMSIIETKFGLLCILTTLWWNIVMDNWNLDEKSLSKWE